MKKLPNTTATADHSFHGWEIFSHQWKMRFKMVTEVGLVVSVLHTFATIVITWIITSNHNFEVAWKYIVAKLASFFFFSETSFSLPGSDGTRFAATAQQLASSAAGSSILQGVLQRGIFAFVLSFGVWFLYPLIIKHMHIRGKKALATEHIRGMQLIESDVLKKELSGKKTVLSFGGIPFPDDYAPEQILLAGKTRVGKTVATIQAIEAIRLSNGKAVIHDFRGELTARFFNPEKDFILNPLDARSTGWNIFNDITSRADLTSLWDSLIPPSSGEDKFWCAAAGNVGKGISAYLWTQNKKSNCDLWDAITGNQDEVEKMLEATPTGASGYKAIAGDARGKQAAGVMAVLLQYTAWLEYAVDGGSFSIDKWLTQKEGGFIFLTGKAEVKETIKPLTGLFIEMLGKKILNLPENPHRRIYFILDELNNLQKLPTLPDLLTGAGAKGAIFWLAIQDFARLIKVYGRESAEAIMNSCGAWLTLKLKDAATADVFSKALGQVQYWDTQHNYRMSANDSSDGETVSRTRQTDWLVMPSEIMSLKKLEGYLSIPEHNPTKIKLEILPVNKRQPTQPDFVMREGWLLDDLRSKQDDRLSAIEELTGIDKNHLAVSDADEKSVLAEREGDSEVNAPNIAANERRVSLDLI
jgi:type IV secretory pathway TraG/TraD family ATPase VirD4